MCWAGGWEGERWKQGGGVRESERERKRERDLGATPFLSFLDFFFHFRESESERERETWGRRP